MTHEGMDPALEEAFERLRQVPAPDAGRQAEQRAALLEGAHRHRALAATPGPRRWALVGMLAAIVLALVVGTGGIVYAADVSVPGDMLYGVDRALESAQLALTSQPLAAADLLWSFTGERLAEAEALDAKAAQESDAEGQDGDGSDSCNGTGSHPVGESLAESYGVGYETIMGWFCDDGFGFGEIMHALETSEVTGDSPEDLLALRADQGWGQIWQDLGLKGKPDHAGPPADKGNDDQDDPGDDDQDDQDDDQDDQDDDQDDQDDDQDDQDDDQDDPGDDDQDDQCVGADPHPVGQHLADTYGVEYDQVMGWFCDDNFGFGEIRHALETSELTELPPDEVLAMRAEMGWGEIWRELGLKDKEKPAKKEKEDKDKPAKEVKEKKEKKEKPAKEVKEKKEKKEKPVSPTDVKEKKDKKEKKGKSGK